MSVIELLAELRDMDAHVVLDGDRLRLNAPAGALTDAHREQLQRRKAEIVEFLRAAQQLAGQQRAIVPLQPHGTRTPLFAVAGHNGDAFCYRALAQHLGTDQPFFGLQPPGLEEGTEPLTRVEDLATYFAAQIREFWPQGPYTIAGFCAGGTVAFELARQLTGSGLAVTNLVMFGAPFCTAYRKLPQLMANTAYLVRRSAVHARELLAMPMSDRRRYFADRLHALQPADTPAPTDPVLARRGLVEEATMAAVRRYEPHPFKGHVDLMLPCKSWKHSADAPLRWSRMAASSAEFVGPDDCNGDNMLLPEHAATFATLFKKARQQHSRGLTIMKDRRFRAGDPICVRSPEEILSMLDADGTLDGVPFMPEMLDWCGKPFRVQRRVEKTCVDGYPMRCFPANDVVILDGPRCDGHGHDGCKHGCRIFWKEAWLRPMDAVATTTQRSETGLQELRARLKVKSDEHHYFCQSTELYKATEAFSGKQKLWTVRIVFREIRSGDLSVSKILSLFVLWSWQRLRRAAGDDGWLRGPHKRTPSESLDLKPGEVVRVKSRAQIVETLDQNRRNRGMGICCEMTRCCGGEAEVRYRVDRIIDERTGTMRELSDTVTLQNMRHDKTLGEECLCYDQLGDCPRGELMYWREIWLERVNRKES